MFILETNRLHLEAFTAQDANLLKDLDSDPEVMRYISDGVPSSDDQIAATLKRVLELNEKYQYRFRVWKAFDKLSEEFIGWFLLRPCKSEPENISSQELGYRLKQKFWGQGLATEGSKALLNYGFQQPEVEVIWAKTMKNNHGSQNVMKKIGMEFEYDFQEAGWPGVVKDAVRYSLKKSQFKKDSP